MRMLSALRFNRPFRNAHWTLLALLVALWEFLLFGQPCHEGPRYFGVALATSTGVLALWVSHIRTGPVLGWRKAIKIFFGAFYDLALLLILLIVVAVPLALVTPTYQCYTARAKILEMLVYASTLREEVEQQVQRQQSLVNAGTGLKVQKLGHITGGLVTKDGMVITVSDDPAAVVTLTPSMDNGVISWKCVGYPTKHMPMSCRDD